MKIAIVGLAGSGKDTFGEMLVEGLGSDWSVAKYATPLKDLTRSMFGDNFDAREVKEVPQILFTNKRVMTKLRFKIVYEVLKFLDKLPKDLAFEAKWKFYEVFDDLESISPRQFQQLFGTEVMRKLDNNFWVDQLMFKEGNLVITDARFENEIDKVDYTFLVVRPELDYKDPKYSHSSEAMAKIMTLENKLGIIDEDFIVICNDGSLEDLESKAVYNTKLLKQFNI